jgi:hypothetical protein
VWRAATVSQDFRVSTNAFDNFPFFYKQLKFTWLVWVVTVGEFGGEIDAPSGDPIPLYDTFSRALSL